MKKIYQLPYEDKAIHRHMAFAANQLNKVARLIRERKSASDWIAKAETAQRSSNIIKEWMTEIRTETKNKEQL